MTLLPRLIAAMVPRLVGCDAATWRIDTLSLLRLRAEPPLQYLDGVRLLHARDDVAEAYVHSMSLLPAALLLL